MPHHPAGGSLLRFTRVSSAIMLVGAMTSFAACNGVTGAGDLKFKDVEETEEDDDSGGGVTTGAGGAGGADGGAQACVYPTENIGNSMGQVVSESLAWQGYPENSAVVSEIKIADYFDCDGSRGINALLVIESALWCPNCQSEAQLLNSKMDGGWKAMGIHVLTLVIEGIEQLTPATMEDVTTWKTTYELNSTAVAADPAFKLQPSGGATIGLPYIHVIDPRTMQVTHVQEGFSPEHPELEALAAKNASPSQ